ncbi:hypothetical protein FRC10_009931 [Ceratobasidium sp. 414]|nr:hypothetical protein FRC10_009931 [Ceratobasidium sp. 414]
MFKSLSSRSTRSSSQSGSSTYTRNTASSSTYTPLPPLPPVPPTPERDVPSIQLVGPTPGKSAEGSPILEKRRTRTLVPRRSVLGKENRPQSENLFSGTREAPAPVDPSLHVTGLVARQFAAQHNRQFHSVGPTTGLSLDSSSAQGSSKTKSGIKHKRVLVESRVYPGGGQVEVVKDTVGRSSKPLLESVRGTFNGGSIRTGKGGTVRKESDENAGTGLVVKKKKSRGTLESIRWALGDRTNGARKAEKEKEKEKGEEKGKESEGEQERKRATSQGSMADRLKTRLTIDTHVPREVPLETPITAPVISPMTMTPGTLTGNTTDNESLAAPSGGEKTKWRWTISKKRAKSPGPSLSSTFDRPAHVRSNSLDPNALMAAKHIEEPEESAAYTSFSPRASSLELPTFINTTAAEDDAQGYCSPIHPARPMPIETAPVDFGFEPRTVRKVSTGSIESHAESGTTQKSSIGSLLSGAGENASNTGSFAVRAMRSVRSMASLARLGGWVKGEEDEKAEKEDKKDKGKNGAAKEKKKRRVKKRPVVVEEETTTSGESWEAGALGHDPTITVTVQVGKPVARQNLHIRDERADLGMRRVSEASREEEQEGEQWARGDRRSSSGSSYAAPSTISSGSYHQSRMSRASSDAHTVRSRQDSVPAAPNVPANPGIIFEHHEEVPASTGGGSAYLGDRAWVGVGADTLKGRTRRTERGEDLGRRARKPVIGLFDIPPAEESQPKALDGAPQVEVRGVKIDKGRVRDRVRAFEARAEEHTGSSAATYSTFSVASGRTAAPPAASNVTSLGRAAASTVDKQRLSYIQEREDTLLSGRCVSVPIFRPSTSPERPTRVRPWSEQMLRHNGEEGAYACVVLSVHILTSLVAAIDIVNAANSDLSDLISRLDLTFTPEAKQASPDTRRIPSWVEETPTRSGPRGPRGAQPALTSLKGYNPPSLVKPASLSAPRVSQALPLSDADDLFSPALSSRAICGHQHPRPRTTKGNNTTLAKSSSGSGRTRIESRRRAGMKGTLGEDSMLAGEDSDGPDSDIPDELQVILAGGSEDEAPLPSPGMPPDVPLPQPEIPRVVIEDTTETQLAVAAGLGYSDDNEAAEASEEELERGSRRSFDFTGELGQLKGGSRNSFVEVLVTAFKTPARPGGSGMADQLELSIDSFNDVPTVTKQDKMVVAKNPTAQDEATEAEISFSRAEALAKLTQPMNKKSSGQLNLDFRFGPSPTNVPAKRPQENSADTSSMSGLANATFALALANLSKVSGSSSTAKRRDASIRFKLDTGSEDAESSRSHTHTRDESAVSQSMSSLGNILHSVASDPFGLNESQSWAQSSNSSHATQHSHQEFMASVSSVPSCGQMLNVSQEDPFDYEALMRELDEASTMIEESTQGLERSAARRRRSKRMSVDSDRSSFYCRTNAPPVSFHNRGYGRHLHLPTESSSSLANAYGNLGANTGRVAWARHRPESADSGISDRYDQFLARPGLGDKMFQTGVEHGIPLPSIMASPTNSEVSADPQFYYEQHTGRYSFVSDQRRNSHFSERRNSYAPSAAEQRRMSFMSYDSLVDGVGDERRYSIDMESLYERRGRTNSISSVSVFGDDHRRRKHNRGGPQPGHFRPVSIISMQSDVSARDDDTMVSMIGGSGEARVRRKSVGSTLLLDASPCFRAEKRAKELAEARSDASRLEFGNASTSMSLFQLNQSEPQEVFSSDLILDNSPSKGKGRSHATPRPFARPRPAAAAKLATEDSGLEEIASPIGTPQTLLPHTRPLTVSCRKSRPMGNMTMSIARNRASALICTAEPPDTPPLSIAGSDASSISGGSQSSIDVSKLMGMLGNTSINSVPSGQRSRAHGQGHRRRSSQLSRSSMVNSFTAEDLPCSTSYSYSAFSNSQVNDSVMIVDPDAQIAELAEMIQVGIQLSDEQMASVTRYCALRTEAIETVERSQEIWQDTDFSRFALSTFTPPTHPSAIKAMIDHSQDLFTALPVELYRRHHPRYSRSPRITPYPTDVTRSVKSIRTHPESVEQLLSHLPPGYTPARPTRTVRESPIVSNMGMTSVYSASPAPTPAALAPLSSLAVNLDPKTAVAEEKTSKQRIASTVRRSALGWVKRKPAADGAHSPAVPTVSKTHVIQSSATTVAKENMGVGMLTSPSNQSLRINRPRPKGRSSASTLRTALRI